MLPPPTALGLPDKFTSWRPNQDDAVLGIVDAESKYIAQVAPTGSGKSLTYIAAAVLSGARTCVLTSTKGLQSQLMADFKDVGLVDIRGQNSYQCKMQTGSEGQVVYCDNGPCKAGYPCKLRDGSCLYYDAAARAKKAKLVVTNYAYWMTSGKFAEGLGDFDLLVLDEAHSAPRELADFCAVELKREEVEGVVGGQWLKGGDVTMAQWKSWARELVIRAEGILSEIQDEITVAKLAGESLSGKHMREVRTLRGVQSRLQTVAQAEGEWIPESGKGVLRLDPLWPVEYAGQYLFRNADKVMLTSATIRQKTLALLGVNGADSSFTEYPSTFPVNRRLVTHVPTVRLKYPYKREDMQLWRSRIDQIIRARRDRKGIVHTVSYTRRDLVLRDSEYSDCMFTHDTRGARSAVENFKRAPAPAVLVSPSMVTGWDFPGTSAEYQIIGKIGFPDTRPAIIQARQADDPEYMHYEAMQTLVQACGRGMRAEDDRCECLVIDDQAKWFVPKYRRFAPNWFWDAWRWGSTIPKPPPKLKIAEK